MPVKLEALGWSPVGRPWRTKMDARWSHRDGWALVHCGHSTAIRPWALFDRAGRMHLSGVVVQLEEGLELDPTCGFAWRTLERAALVVDEHGPAMLAAMDRVEATEPEAIRWDPEARRRAS